MGGLLIKEVVVVVMLLFNNVWCKFGFFKKLLFVIELIVIILFICFIVGVIVMGSKYKIVFKWNFGKVMVGILNYVVFCIGVKFIIFRKRDNK